MRDVPSVVGICEERGVLEVDQVIVVVVSCGEGLLEKLPSIYSYKSGTSLAPVMDRRHARSAHIDLVLLNGPETSFIAFWSGDGACTV